YFQSFPDASTPGAPPSPRQPTIALVDSLVFDHVSTITVSGRSFKGVTEAGSGGADNTASWSPHIMVQALDALGGSGSQGSSGFALDLSTRIYSSLNPLTGILYNTSNNGADNTGNWSIVDSSISIAMPSA